MEKLGVPVFTGVGAISVQNASRQRGIQHHVNTGSSKVFGLAIVVSGEAYPKLLDTLTLCNLKGN